MRLNASDGAGAPLQSATPFGDQTGFASHGALGLGIARRGTPAREQRGGTTSGATREEGKAKKPLDANPASSRAGSGGRAEGSPTSGRAEGLTLSTPGRTRRQPGLASWSPRSDLARQLEPSPLWPRQRGRGQVRPNRRAAPADSPPRSPRPEPAPAPRLKAQAAGRGGAGSPWAARSRSRLTRGLHGLPTGLEGKDIKSLF